MISYYADNADNADDMRTDFTASMMSNLALEVSKYEEISKLDFLHVELSS